MYLKYVIQLIFLNSNLNSETIMKLKTIHEMNVTQKH